MKLGVVALVLVTQALFTAGDVLARSKLRAEPGSFVPQLLAPWIIGNFVIRQIATLGQLYILATVELGRTASFYAVASLLIASGIGVFVLDEALSPTGYLGVALAVLAFVVLALDVQI